MGFFDALKMRSPFSVGMKVPSVFVGFGVLPSLRPVQSFRGRWIEGRLIEAHIDIPSMIHIETHGSRSLFKSNGIHTFADRGGDNIFASRPDGYSWSCFNQMCKFLNREFSFHL